LTGKDDLPIGYFTQLGESNKISHIVMIIHVMIQKKILWQEGNVLKEQFKINVANIWDHILEMENLSIGKVEDAEQLKTCIKENISPENRDGY
jgi:hypothetical protein